VQFIYVIPAEVITTVIKKIVIICKLNSNLKNRLRFGGVF